MEEQVMTLELTTRFKGISTSPAARGQSGTATDALKRCYGALNYAARENAVGNICWQGLRRSDGNDVQTAKEARLALRQRFRTEAAKGGKVGRRLATTGIVSLPNTWNDEAVKSAMSRLAKELAPPDSEASVFIVQHIDKSNNAHLHFVAVDGVESRDAAKRRARPDAQRIRQQNVQRFNERGAPKRWRKRIADVLNMTAEEHGLAGVEWKSFKERGLRRKATAHDGPEKRARRRRDGTEVPLADFFNVPDDMERGLECLWNNGNTVIQSADRANEAHGGERRQME